MVRLTDRPDMTLDVYRGRKTTKQQQISGVTIFNLCKMAGLLYICTKFREIISNGIKIIERTRFLYGKLQRRIIPQKM